MPNRKCCIRSAIHVEDVYLQWLFQCVAHYLYAHTNNEANALRRSPKREPAKRMH